MTPYQQGIAHYKSGDYQLGLINFNEAIRNGHQPLEAAYYERSKCYEALGQIVEAKSDLAYILALPVNETWRKQITGLITLLEQTSPPPESLPPQVNYLDPIGQFTSILVGLVLVIIILSCAAAFCNVEYNYYNETRLLQQAPQYTIAQVIRKQVIQSKNPSYEISYQYTIPQPQGESRTFDGHASVSGTIYNQTEGTVRIIYVASDPAISRLADNFSPSNEYLGVVISTGFISCLGSIVISVIFGLLFGMRQAQQIETQGRLTQAIILAKRNQQQGKSQTNEVCYGYYGYEAWFNLKAAFDVLEVGDMIKVGYLPDKPYISKPYWEQPSPRAKGRFKAFVAAAIAGVMVSNILTLLMFSLTVILPNNAWLYLLIALTAPISSIAVSMMVAKRLGSISGFVGLVAGLMGYMLFGWCGLAVIAELFIQLAHS